MPPYNGSGTFLRIYDWTDDAANAIPITASRMDGDSDGFATGLSTAITKDGQTTVTANLPMSNFKHTGVGTGSSRTDYADVASSQDQTYLWGGTSGGTGNAQTIGTTPVTAAYVSGQTYRFKAGNANTAAATLAVNGLTAKAIQVATAALVGGEIASGSVVEVVYDGTQFQLISVSGAVAQITTGLFGNGTVSLPSIAFASDTDTGIYRIGANNIGVTANGAKVLDVSTTGLAVTGTLNSSGDITTSSNVTVGNNITTGDAEINIGQGRSGNGNSLIDLIGDTTYSGFGLRIIRNATGANAQTDIQHRGTGEIAITAIDAGSISLNTNSMLRLSVSSAGAAQFTGTLGVTGASTLAAVGATDITASGFVSAATVTGAQVATKAQMETATATDVIVTPGRQQNHPMHPKCGAAFDGVGAATISAQSGITSITRDSAGRYTVVPTVAFSSDTAMWLTGSATNLSNNKGRSIGLDTANTTASSIKIIVRDAADDASDADSICFTLFGDQ